MWIQGRSTNSGFGGKAITSETKAEKMSQKSFGAK
jgi:hypothetical protein